MRARPLSQFSPLTSEVQRAQRRRPCRALRPAPPHLNRRRAHLPAVTFTTLRPPVVHPVAVLWVDDPALPYVDRRGQIAAELPLELAPASGDPIEPCSAAGLGATGQPSLPAEVVAATRGAIGGAFTWCYELGAACGDGEPAIVDSDPLPSWFGGEVRAGAMARLLAVLDSEPVTNSEGTSSGPRPTRGLSSESTGCGSRTRSPAGRALRDDLVHVLSLAAGPRLRTVAAPARLGRLPPRWRNR